MAASVYNPENMLLLFAGKPTPLSELSELTITLPATVSQPAADSTEPETTAPASKDEPRLGDSSAGRAGDC